MTSIADLTINFDNDSLLSTKVPNAYIRQNSQNIISNTERQRRQKVWEGALANSALEGVYPSEDMKRISQMYINGEITFEQKSKLMKESILAGK